MHFHLFPLFIAVYTEDHSRQSRGCDNCPYVAHSDLLPQVDVHVDSTVKTATEERELVKIAPLPEKPPAMKENAADVLYPGIASRQNEFRKKQKESCCSHG